MIPSLCAQQKEATYTKRVLNFRRQAIVEQKTAGGIPSAVHLPVLRLFDRDRLFLG